MPDLRDQIADTIAAVLHDHGPMGGREATRSIDECENGHVHRDVGIRSAEAVMAVVGPRLAAAEALADAAMDTTFVVVEGSLGYVPGNLGHLHAALARYQETIDPEDTP